MAKFTGHQIKVLINYFTILENLKKIKLLIAFWGLDVRNYDILKMKLQYRYYYGYHRI